jgi:hypothetical protein
VPPHSLTHVRACSRFKTDENGQEVIASSQENRLTSLIVHVLIGISIFFFRPLIRQVRGLTSCGWSERGLIRYMQVPLAALLGVFLYMGKGSLAGNQMVRGCYSLPLGRCITILSSPSGRGCG